MEWEVVPDSDQEQWLALAGVALWTECQPVN